LGFTVTGSPTSGVYLVTAVPDFTHFSVLGSPTNANTTQNGLTTFALVPPPLVRAGTVVDQFSTWGVGFTDTGSSSSLAQTPLNSPTVFNFFFPNYEFPGILATAGLTTPEFQLTSDTASADQMNFLQSGVLNNNNYNSGLVSFNSSTKGAIVMDFGPYMLTNNVNSSAAIGNLVDSLNTLLIGGQLPAAAKTSIVNYTLGTSSTSSTWVRDRVEGIVHLLVTSPDFTIQK
jgi:hypothetical protein